MNHIKAIAAATILAALTFPAGAQSTTATTCAGPTPCTVTTIPGQEIATEPYRGGATGTGATAALRSGFGSVLDEVLKNGGSLTVRLADDSQTIGTVSMERVAALTIQSRPTNFVIVGRDDKCRITISLINGSTKLDGCGPDEAGRAFWDAVSRMYPGTVKPQ